LWCKAFQNRTHKSEAYYTSAGEHWILPTRLYDVVLIARVMCGYITETLMHRSVLNCLHSGLQLVSASRYETFEEIRDKCIRRRYTRLLASRDRLERIIPGRSGPTKHASACTFVKPGPKSSSETHFQPFNVNNQKHLVVRAVTESTTTMAIAVPVNQDDRAGCLKGKQMKLLMFASARFHRDSGMLDSPRTHTNRWNGGIRNDLEVMRSATSGS